VKELPGDVFISGQISAENLTTLAEQGMQSFINNRPDHEQTNQPQSRDLREVAQTSGVDYAYVPMGGIATPDLIEKAAEAYATLPRPILAFCGSGPRSAMLWAFSHVKDLGVDGVLNSLEVAGLAMPQIRPQLQAWLSRTAS